jgi:hypothetical protein
MATKETIPQLGRLEDERQALHSVLSSPAFKRNPRLASLLRHICEKYFEGDTESIKEYSIAADVFHRPETFDQSTDSIVRVEFHRLRKKLREFYDGEGADQPIEIVVATGHYLPEFIDRDCGESYLHPLHGVDPHTQSEIEDNSGPGFEHRYRDKTPPVDAVFNRTTWRRDLIMLYAIGGAICLFSLAAALFWLRRPQHASASVAAVPALPAPAPALSSPEMRIRCGYTKAVFKDQEGNLWMGDRFFSGGTVTELPDQHINRTRDSQLYLTSRSGSFSYKIPLKPGIYELRLHFAETTYTPSSTLGGGENSRVFDVLLNGKPLLNQFDIVSDAGVTTADVRVFKDVQPGPDGNLRLDFSGYLGLPMINAIEILPGALHRLRPIRMVAQNSFFVDKSGELWSPDTYFSGGQLAADKIVIGGPDDAGLYTGERYGNFSYALPADPGSYAVTLYFSEKYWGTGIAKAGGIGSRVFSILCNGVALKQNLDVVREAGPARAMKLTFHGLHPNAQGKVLLSFVPEVNYATVDAVQMEEEGP